MQETTRRFVPLDILRGLTVAMMITVNNAGNWEHIYAPLEHAKWDGCTPTDLVFPFFLFCVGMAMAWSLSRFNGLCKPALWKILRRGVVIFLVGLFLNAFPFDHWWRLRYFGVLQRIALCYVVASLLVLTIKSTRGIWIAIAALLVSYTAILLIFGEPGAQFTLEGNVSRKIDIALCGENHIYKGYGIPFDPEGPLGVLSGSCTAMIGYLVGRFLRGRSECSAADNTAHIFMFGMIALAAGEILSIWIPINKSLWSASYVFFAAGWAMTVLGVIMFLYEMKGVHKVFVPAQIFGTNALTAFFLSGFLSRCISLLHLHHSELFATDFLSLVYALCFMLCLFFISWLLYRKHIIIKI